MTKKIFLVLAAVVLSWCAATAQNAVGDWRIHTSFVGSDVTSIVESREWVYYLSGGNLFRLDKQTEENEALSIVNDLSDMGIRQMYYNSDKDYLVVVYNNSNIDVILSNGSVVNMSELKDAVMTSSKVINDVTFADGLMYMATDFGYLVIDDRNFVVKESHNYGTSMVSVAQVGDKLFLSMTDSVLMYCGDANRYHDQLSSFTPLTFKEFNDAKPRIYPIDDHTFFCLTGWTFFVTVTVGEDGAVDALDHELLQSKATVQKAPGGYLLNAPKLNKCYWTDENAHIVSETETAGEKCSAHPDGDGTLWAAGSQGLHQLGVENYYLPNALSFAVPFWMTYNKGKDLLYVSSPATNVFFDDNAAQPCYVNTFDGMRWKNVTPDRAPKYGTFWLDFQPDNDDAYFICGWTNGLHKVVDGQIVLTYNAQNSPLVKSPDGAMHPIMTIDRNGNIWVVQSYENPEHPLMVLPAAKAKLDQVEVSDWITPKLPDLYTGHSKRACILSTRQGSNDIKIFNDGDFKMPVVFWNSGGTIPTEPPKKVYNKLTDQDGQSFAWTHVMCFTEDLNGIVWMGCSEGVVSFNPAQAFSGDFRVNHIKVPRNDGTGMADYLLDGIQVNDIAVDGANRKWIATDGSGLFLVSADGTKIINKFNTTNSPLASNQVYRVCCNPNSNSVYVTTPAGLYEYFSDSSPAESSYDNIYAYPNPVRPEYTGNVTIKGLMDNSLVKIADASGHVICQLKSTGGMVTWDCCDQWGERVKTGVYMVLCSRANGSGEAVVTKIAVIR